ncbi:MAG TPA: hypothetical protein VK757_04985 [Candidatus Acidoferrum sp.]|nr:hypothetical protein [Candidatus Acidoferrum sp.]
MDEVTPVGALAVAEGIRAVGVGILLAGAVLAEVVRWRRQEVDRQK